jgi:hypothetical protein
MSALTDDSRVQKRRAHQQGLSAASARPGTSSWLLFHQYTILLSGSLVKFAVL